MTREEAIERLKQNKAAAEFYAGMVQNTNAIENELKDIEAIDMAIQALSAEAVQRWVPCSERLPSKSGDYLCTIPLDASETYTGVLTFYKGKFYEDDLDEWGALYHDDVLAWMPLPEPYEPKTERRG